ncbi:2'-5' RNA ligase family protein [Allostreptomyces psammosilenae]|uniref:2'-5' RNA ligase n=1 Tax=Allostreptomyces psammosilenae TaxID=1892865 RepID=A0A853ABX3_9ACTN|nr:2'-5' RNA ligase family protein [Allostreptomyces psammosilenae]NYI07978.1 2'-5' RNA ligase [Allostreptomyces psammosilenae]
MRIGGSTGSPHTPRTHRHGDRPTAEPERAADRAGCAADTVTIGVSIPVPEPHGSLLQDSRAGFGDPLARCIPTHITLLPPTEVAGDALPAIDAHLRRVAEEGKPFDLRLEGTGTFRPVSPVVFVRVAEGAEGCSRLQEAVRSGPLRRELHFPYHPHVTVAHDIAEAAMDRAFEELADYRGAFLVEAFSLYRHGEDGVWRPVRHYAFA